MFESRRWCPTRSPYWDCDRINCALGRKVYSNWQEVNDRQCNNCTEVFPWFHTWVQHNAWLFEVLERCAQWVPIELKVREKNEVNGPVLAPSLTVCRWRKDVLNRSVAGNESWVHHYQPESKCASLQWKHTSSPSTKKSKVAPSDGKVMLTMFWDSQGVLLAHFQKWGENVNSASCCEVSVRDAICRKRPRQVARNGLLHHDPIEPK
jgi:hypothetical protein